MALGSRYVITVWSMTLAAFVLFGLMGLYGSLVIPLLLVFPLVLAVGITFPVLYRRQWTRRSLIPLLTLIGAAAVVVEFLVIVDTSPLRDLPREIGFGAWGIGCLLPFVIAVISIRDASRQRPHDSIVSTA
jgi:uncharacterized membrane protein